MTRVLMVNDGLWEGGAERQLALLASSLPEPWSASVLAMEDGPYRQVIEGLGIDVRIVPRRSRLDVTAAARMWRAASAFEPSVVHAWGWMSALAMVPYCRARRIPLLDGAIRFGALPPGRLSLFRAGLHLSDVIVANSRAGLAAFGIAQSDRARVIYNGFDRARLAGITPSDADIAPHERTVAIMAARMYPEKDWRLLFEAARRLAGETGRWRFVAMGDGPERDMLSAEASDLVGAAIVEFQDRREVLPALATADMGVLLTDTTSHAEGCSNAIMEYMACGLPVVCTDCGGNPELVEDGVTGFLVPPADVDALVSALRTLRDDHSRARAMGQEGRRRLEEHFTVGRMTAGYLAAYGSVLDPIGRAAG